MREWRLSFGEFDRGTLAICLHEVTEGKPGDQREVIQYELSLSETIRLFEGAFRALAYHLRLMA